jgi:hypothetical protein
MSISFEKVLIKSIREALADADGEDRVNALLKMMVEVRESAKMNEDFVAYERITSQLEELGVVLAEEVHVTARIKAS